MCLCLVIRPIYIEELEGVGRHQDGPNIRIDVDPGALVRFSSGGSASVDQNKGQFDHWE